MGVPAGSRVRGGNATATGDGDPYLGTRRRAPRRRRILGDAATLFLFAAASGMEMGGAMRSRRRPRPSSPRIVHVPDEPPPAPSSPGEGDSLPRWLRTDGSAFPGQRADDEGNRDVHA